MGVLLADCTRVIHAGHAEPLQDRIDCYDRIELAICRRTGNGGLVATDQEREREAARVLALPDALATFRPLHGSIRTSSLDLYVGDRVRMFWHRDRLLGLAQESDEAEVTTPIENPSWIRYRSDSDLVAAVAIRYPGFLLESLAIEEVGVSGRVGSLRLSSTSGETFVIRGLAIRWTLDLPDTLFTVDRRTGDSAGWVFRGRGRGHGVGLCQKGSYAMALRGLTYREILTHYYSGIAIERLPAGSGR